MSDFAQEVLKAHDVHKSYSIGKRKLEVLRGADMVVQRGEMVALKGASGAGKSTLLHLFGGLDSPDCGELLFDGRSIGGFSADEMYRYRNERIGLVFQAYHLLPELDALENVMLTLRIGRVPTSEARERATALLARVGLSERMQHRPAELSGGEQQRVSIARALVREPEILLADEPTGNLDTQTGNEIIGLLQEVCREQGTTLVIATHDDKVADAVPRVIELVDGCVV